MQSTLEQELSPRERQKLRNNRTGLLIFQLSWILVFVSLVVANLQIRGNYPTWPPEGVESLPVALPLLATLALVGSSIVAHSALNALKVGTLQAFLSRWTLVLILGALFVLIMTYEWIAVPEGAGQYGSLFRVMTAFHAIHALVIGLFLWRTWRFAGAGLYGPRNFWAAEAGVRLWNFVTIAWLLFFAVLYLI